MITVGLGALYYLKAPRTFQSETDILITNKHFAGFRNGDADRPVSEETIETHAIRLQSQLIIQKAVEAHDLASLPSLVEQEDPVKYIIENMLVQLKDDNSTVLNARFRCQNPSDCRDVVQAIAKTYESYLGESNERGGQHTAQLIKQANKILREQMVDSEQAYREFQRKRL